MQRSDYVLVGSGIMSATLGVLLKKLDPEARIHLFEGADSLSPESSHAWNNAGTGHAGICELSYTPFRNPDGSIDVSKAIEIFAQFEKSRQFWSSALREGILKDRENFLNPVAHVSFVYGEELVAFLRDRCAALRGHHFFEEMEYTEDPTQIRQWAPLLMEGRSSSEPVAATRMAEGTDVNFGVIARQLAGWLKRQDACEVHAGTPVTGLERIRDGWEVVVRERKGGRETRLEAGFVFIGAGGGSLPLLQKAGIPEAKGYGGFPVGGQWLVCGNPGVVEGHRAKVYGLPQGESPTLAVPHLDMRVIDGKNWLLFGPFAAWTTKFLKDQGSWLDLPRSIRADNAIPLLRVGMKEVPLVKYLIREGLQSMESRLALLRTFYPEARAEDWELVDAGIRVQAIKEEDGKTGILHFGTEVLTDETKTIAALLGASPGASVSVDVMLNLVHQCFGDPAASPALLEMIPSLGMDLKLPENRGEFRRQRSVFGLA